VSDVSYQNSSRARFSSAVLRLLRRAIAANDLYERASTVTRDYPLDISPLQSELVVYGQGGQGFFCNATVGGPAAAIWTSEPITQLTSEPLAICSGSAAMICTQTWTATSDTMVALLYAGESNGTISGVTAGTIFGTAALVSAPSSVVEPIFGWRQSQNTKERAEYEIPVSDASPISLRTHNIDLSWLIDDPRNAGSPERLRSLYKAIQRTLREADYDFVDKMFEAVDVQKLPVETLIAMLRYSFASHKRLNAWREFLDRVRGELGRRKLDTRSLLSGLEAVGAQQAK
jgi:hypothetical protein